ncbi:MAG: cation transporter, partial [Candidatus Baldrarchaeia archaeon]
MLTDEKYDFRGEKLTLLITYLSNISVAAIKGVFGFLSLSLALIADAIHSLFDSVSNIVGLWAFKMMEKPVDTDHPYGHER